MVSSKRPIHYTFQLVQENPFRIIRVHKWYYGDSQPHQYYEVFPDGRKGAGACSCPAFKVCKHIRCVDELYTEKRQHYMHMYLWTEAEGWSEAHDI